MLEWGERKKQRACCVSEGKDGGLGIGMVAHGRLMEIRAIQKRKAKKKKNKKTEKERNKKAKVRKKEKN